MYADPLKFVLWAFDWGNGDLTEWDGPDAWQTEFLTKLGEAVRGRTEGDAVNMAVKAGRGCGKTAVIAWIILWLMSTRKDFAGVVTANTGDQLDSKTFRELALWWQRSINKHWFQWTATRFYQVDNKTTWGVDALKWAEHRADAFGGLHNNGRGQAIIIDEGSGVADSIYDVADATMTDPDSFQFVFANPVRKRGRFYELFTRFAHRWINMTVDIRRAKAANQAKIARDIEDWGENSDFIRVNVKGEFPEQEADTLIPLPLIESARVRVAAECERYRPIWGVDPARFGDDRTAKVHRRHRRTEKVDQWRGLDTMQTVGRIKAEWNECNLDDRPTHIIVDVIGIGAGIVDRLRELDFGDTEIVPINVSESPAIKSKFHRLRDDLYWRGREWFEGLNVQCEQPEIGAELGDVLYSFTSAGQIKVESKDEVKERLRRSPDVGEAFLLTLMRDCLVISEDRGDRYRRARSRVEESAWAA